jgi:predicted RNA-binding Zn-ribbon protein involved in translation (DUF1610 family)
MIRSFLSRFMAGRYGTDQLNNTMIIAYVVLYLISIFTRWSVLYWIALVLVFVTLFRTMSRQLDRRRAENAKFLQLVRPLNRKLKNLKVRIRDKDHRYFKCPNCGQQLRVPRGKGKLNITCRNCGVSFEKKT